ncbi:MAG TPA: Tex-like N-terminal domain-containing protein [Pirellulales bacterium]|nr:Tex-like N-terminal domain-containing protein [Pirellulales bacterium]
MTTIDLGPLARDLGLAPERVGATIQLLDDGNTVPFITRYRKDQTGGLDEVQIRDIESRVNKLRQLAERKQTILRSIEAQNKLTPELAAQISGADSLKRLEDLYLPFKPKKQTLATAARERGLEPLADEIFIASPACADLDARARDFINPDKQIVSVADVLLGVGHILAENFSERADLRGRLRKIFKRTGKLVSTRIESEKKAESEAKSAESKSTAPKTPKLAATEQISSETIPAPATSTEPAAGEMPSSDMASNEPPPGPTPADLSAVPPNQDPPPTPAIQAADDAQPARSESPEMESAAPAWEAAAEMDASAAPAATDAAETALPETALPRTMSSELPAAESALEKRPVAAESGAMSEATSTVLPAPATEPGSAAPSAPASMPAPAVASAKSARVAEREKKRKAKDKAKDKLQEKLEHDFRDYFAYSEQIGRIPPHRVLAINRGEKARILRVKIDADVEALHQEGESLVVAENHPHADFLRGCAKDALTRLVIPSLEREIRRELTENAETHAVEVFARNLRNLLLQPPIQGRRVLAIDPGFKSGCKLAALDEFGNLLDHGVVHLIGKEERKKEARAKLVEMIQTHSLKVVAIGNGTACRETEDMLTEILGNELQDQGVAYVIVNEAGASVYSTSPLGREEFPNFDATLRGAISIGRRLLDPLSELVKIDPANIGVGLYQHDVKAKHLRTSLDAVIESCVNYVGVDLNTASPALLRYVSGLNQLTARRVYDHRQQHGPFARRDQLKEVAGFGESAFVQAAGFLKITGGEEPLDSTWIHPESYAAARHVLEKLDCAPTALVDKETPAQLAERAQKLDPTAVAAELHVGALSLKDILVQLTRPGRDPREDLPPPIFKRGVLKLDDLTPGMELTGSVLNVVDFGAFVDIGLHDSGLVHISQLANKYIRDPHEVVAVGDVVKVWVLEIDKTRRRVSLTMIAPGTPRTPPQKHGGSKEGQRGERRPPRPANQNQNQGQSAGTAAGAPTAEGGARPASFTPRPKRFGDQEKRPFRGGQQGGTNRPHFKSPPPKPKPKPLVPITKKMVEGKEPMRTFGDLFQFVKIKTQPDEPASEPAPQPGQRGAPPKRPRDPAVGEVQPEATRPADAQQAAAPPTAEPNTTGPIAHESAADATSGNASSASESAANSTSTEPAPQASAGAEPAAPDSAARAKPAESAPQAN